MTPVPFYTFSYKQPEFSPEGRMVARWGGCARNLTRSPGNERIGAYSPDRRYMAFGSIADVDREVFVMARDGSRWWGLTRRPGFDGDPVWLPLPRKKWAEGIDPPFQ